MHIRQQNTQEEDVDAIDLKDFNSYSNKHTDYLNSLPVSTASKKAVKRVGPRVYELTGFSGDTLCFNVVGCYGTGDERQYAVATLMQEVAFREKRKRDFTLYLGDNIYPKGPDDPQSVLFDLKYNNPFYNNNLTAIHNTPGFVLSGNHDRGSRSDENRILINEIAHTYVPDQVRKLPDNGKRFLNVGELEAFFEQKTLPINELQAWVDPYYFYSIIAGDTQIFLLNSNTLLVEALEYLEYLEALKAGVKANISPINQMKWLVEQYQIAIENHKKISIALHNPLVTQTKRAEPYGYDTNQYINSSELARLKLLLGVDTDSHAELLALVLLYFKIYYEVAYTAHDHNLNYYNTKYVPLEDIKHDRFHLQICQVGAGAGGGESQSRRDFAGQPFTGVYNSGDPGFVTVTCSLKNPDRYMFDFHRSGNRVVRFKDDSHLPVRTVSKNPLLENFRKVLLKTINDYFAGLTLLKKKTTDHVKEPTRFGLFGSSVQKLSDKFNDVAGKLSYNVSALKTAVKGFQHADIDHIHELQSYLNQPELVDLDAIVIYLFETLKKLQDKESTNAFIYFFKNNFYQNPPFQGQSDILKIVELVDTQYHLGLNAKP